MLLFSFPCGLVVKEEEDDENEEEADMRITVGGDSDNVVSVVGDIVTGSNVGESTNENSAEGANVVGVMVGCEVLNIVLFAQ